MNFALDLLDAITEESPSSVLPIVQRAAQTGEHLVVSRWVGDQVRRANSGQLVQLGADDGPFINAMLSLAACSDGKQASPAAAAFGQWAKAAFGAQPERFSELLSWCVHSTRPTLDSAGHELLELGADPMSPSRPDEHESPCALSGVKVGLIERRATLVARALSYQHPLAAELITRSSTARDPWPVVAEVGVDGTFFPVNAAGYAIALGDAKMLRQVCKHTQGDEHQMGIGLADAVDFALSSGLSKDCTPEMAQCVAVCIASGADLDHLKIGARLTAQRVSLACEVSDFQYQGDPSYAISALFISARTGAESLAAISRLANDYQLELNGPVTQAGSRASLLHYAAASGHAGLVEGLVKLGADGQARDVKGLTPAMWAKVFDRASTLDVLDPGRHLSAAAAKQAEPKSAGETPVEADWDHDDGAWRGNENGDAQESMTLDEFSALHDGAPVQSVQSVMGAVLAPAAPAVVSRDSIAPSATGAQASRGAALFSRLKSSQANIAAKAAAKDDAKEVVNKAEQAERLSAPNRMAFRVQA